MIPRIMRLVLLLLVLVGLVPLAVSAGGDTTIYVKPSTLADHECHSGEWHFVINQVASNPPASITVRWSDGYQEVVQRWKFTGGVAHYVTTSRLNKAVVNAWTTIYSGWSGQFNLSHGPCVPPTATPTNTKVPPTATPTATRVPPTVIVETNLCLWNYQKYEAGNKFYPQTWVTSTTSIPLEGVVITTTIMPTELVDTYVLGDQLGNGGTKVGTSIVWQVGTLSPGEGVLREVVARIYTNGANHWITVSVTITANGLVPVTSTYSFYAYPPSP